MRACVCVLHYMVMPKVLNHTSLGNFDRLFHISLLSQFKNVTDCFKRNFQGRGVFQMKNRTVNCNYCITTEEEEKEGEVGRVDVGV